MQVNGQGHTAIGTVVGHRPKNDEDKGCEVAFRFTSNLRAIMNIRNISRGTIAKELKTSINNIDSWCNGSRIPQPDNMKKLLAYLNTEVGHVFPKLEKEKSMKPLAKADNLIGNTESIIKKTNKFLEAQIESTKPKVKTTQISAKPKEEKVENQPTLVDATAVNEALTQIMCEAKAKVARLLSVREESVSLVLEVNVSMKA